MMITIKCNTLGQVFKSLGRVKVLKFLILKKSCSISQIVSYAKMNHQSVNKHLRKLVDLGVVDEKAYGRVRVFRVRDEDIKVRAIVNLFELWGETLDE